MAKWGVRPPKIDVELPFEVLEEVGDWFERVVGSGSWVSEQVKEGFDGSLVGGVEKKMLAEST